MNSNPTPRWVRRAVIVCVAMPAGLVRILSSFYACLAWGATLTGLRPHPTWSSLAMFLAAVAVGILAYLVVVGVDFFTAEHPHSVGAKRIAANMAIELGVQLLAIACICLLISGVVASSPALGIAGLVAGIASVAIGYLCQGRIKAWKEAWNPRSTDP